VRIAKRETLEEAYRIAKRNGGAPGIDDLSFEDIEASAPGVFLAEIQADLRTGRYEPKPNRRVEIPKGNGKVRILQVPCIRDRVVQGALKLILEAVFEADFCPNSYGFRPKRSPHRALAEVRRSVLRRMSTVVDVDLSRYFDTIQHPTLLDRSRSASRIPRFYAWSSRLSKRQARSGFRKEARSARSRRIST
jgi:retron-type reverse transcriptase